MPAGEDLEQQRETQQSEKEKNHQLEELDNENREQRISYKNFLSLASFVASIGVSLTVLEAHSLASSTSYNGRSDKDTIAAVIRTAYIYTWSAVLFGMALVFSLPGQMLETSPTFVRIFRSRERRGGLQWIHAVMSWISLGSVASGTVLVGEGLKLNSRMAGLTLQWTLFAVACPLLAVWISFCYKPIFECMKDSTSRFLKCLPSIENIRKNTCKIFHCPLKRTKRTKYSSRHGQYSRQINVSISQVPLCTPHPNGDSGENGN